MKKSLVTGLITLGLAAMLSGCGSSSEINVDTATEDVKTVGDIYKEKIGYAADFYIVEVGSGPEII